MVGFVDEFQAADESFDFGFGVGDPVAQRGDSLGVFGFGVGMEVGVGQQDAAVVAEDVLVQEGVEVFGDVVFADEERASGGMAFGDVALFRGTHVVGSDAAGLAEHPPVAQVAVEMGPVPVRAFGVGVGVRPGPAS